MAKIYGNIWQEFAFQQICDDTMWDQHMDKTAKWIADGRLVAMKEGVVQLVNDDPSSIHYTTLAITYLIPEDQRRVICARGLASRVGAVPACARDTKVPAASSSPDVMYTASTPVQQLSNEEYSVIVGDPADAGLVHTHSTVQHRSGLF